MFKITWKITWLGDYMISRCKRSSQDVSQEIFRLIRQFMWNLLCARDGGQTIATTALTRSTSPTRWNKTSTLGGRTSCATDVLLGCKPAGPRPVETEWESAGRLRRTDWARPKHLTRPINKQQRFKIDNKCRITECQLLQSQLVGLFLSCISAAFWITWRRGSRSDLVLCQWNLKSATIEFRRFMRELRQLETFHWKNTTPVKQTCGDFSGKFVMPASFRIVTGGISSIRFAFLWRCSIMY